MNAPHPAEKGLRANITTQRGEHRRWCDYSGRGDATTWAFPGDVRRCPHGRIQLAYAVPGSVPAYWRDLSPVFTPILYRRARRALPTVFPPAVGHPAEAVRDA